MANRPSVFNSEFFDAGVPAAGYKLYTYASGTTTPKATYTNQAGTIPNTNPITLDADGMCELWLGSGEYTLALYTGLIGSGGALVKTWDDVEGAASADLVAGLSDDTDPTKGADLIGYQGRTVRDALIDAHNAKDYEYLVVGGDWAPVIQQLVNEYSSVRLPGGTVYTIASNITVPSNRFIYGDGADTVVKFTANGMQGFTTGSSAAKSNIHIKWMTIDGGGQTGGIGTGVRGGTGVYATWVTGLVIEDVVFQNMGVANVGAPGTDSGYGGFGITLEARYGGLDGVRITRCTANNIAGGGNGVGDGFYIAGYAAGAGTTYVDVVLRDCRVSTVGRHCYTVAGGAGQKTPSGVKFINCYGEKSALDGLDIEEGHDVLVDGCTFKACGNDQTYYNPVALYGATYRLLAGVATGSASNDISIVNTTFDGCYYGVTEGGGDGLRIQGCTFKNSTVSDITKGLASSTTNLKVVSNEFRSVLPTLGFYNLSAGCGFSAEGNTFAGTVNVPAMQDGVFDNNTFKRGLAVTGGSSGFARNKIVGNNFLDWVGVGIQCDGVSYLAPDNVVDGNTFYGSGNLTIGVSFAFDSALRWVITNNKFVGLTTAGINHGNGNARHAFDADDNSFVSCAAGILVNQAVNDSSISGNTFDSVTGYCIAITNIGAGAPMRSTNVQNNIVGTGCANGIQITVGAGTFDYCLITGNNAHGATGTKWNLSGGQNANGVTANNITT